MFRRSIVALLSMVLFVPALASAEEFEGFKKGDFTLSLSGTGTNDKNFDDGAFAIQIQPSFFFTDNIEVGLRQNVSYANDFAGSTTVFGGYNFNLGGNARRFVPYVGASIGYNYGRANDSSWIAGPEAGIRYFVNDTTYVYTNAQYLFDLGDGFDKGAFVYGLGLGFRF